MKDANNKNGKEKTRESRVETEDDKEHGCIHRIVVLYSVHLSL